MLSQAGLSSRVVHWCRLAAARCGLRGDTTCATTTTTCATGWQQWRRRGLRGDTVQWRHQQGACAAHCG
eukprot:366116-Chlamydomonas_euryale.AAC.5